MTAPSPALNRAVRGILDDSAFAIFNRIYTLAADCGSFRELDFARDETSSFNPRPARIVQIGIEASMIINLPELATAVLSCCSFHQKTDSHSVPELPKEIFDEAAEVGLFAEQLTPPQDNLSPLQISLVKIHLLDRARHLHLAPEQRIIDVLPTLCAAIEFIQGSDPQKDPVSSKLIFWLKNRAPQLNPKI